MTARAARAGARRWQQRGITMLMAARMGVARQQWQQRQWKQGPGRGQCGGNNSGKSRGDTAMTAARTIVRNMGQGKGNAVTVTGHQGNGGGKVGSNGGGESKGQRPKDSGVPQRWRQRQRQQGRQQGQQRQERGTQLQQRRRRLSSLSYFLFLWSGYSHEFLFFCSIST